MMIRIGKSSVTMLRGNRWLTVIFTTGKSCHT